MWDNDNVDHRALLLYNNNNEVIASSIGGSGQGYLSVIMPRGAGSWYFAGGDVNSWHPRPIPKRPTLHQLMDLLMEIVVMLVSLMVLVISSLSLIQPS